MGRRRSQERKNPPQIKLYTEGETEKIYFDALRSIVGIKGGISYSAKQVNKQGLDLFYYVKRCYTRHNFETSPVKIVLVIDKDNKFFIDDAEISEDELKDKLNAVDIKTLIELKSDKNAKFDSFVKVIDILKEKGHENFAIQTISE